MSCTVWIMVEDDDAEGDEGRTWWSVDHFDTPAEGIERAQEIADDIYNHTGSQPARLDD